MIVINKEGMYINNNQIVFIQFSYIYKYSNIAIAI
jgi:hypothetical protein